MMQSAAAAAPNWWALSLEPTQSWSMLMAPSSYRLLLVPFGSSSWWLQQSWLVSHIPLCIFCKKESIHRTSRRRRRWVLHVCRHSTINDSSWLIHHRPKYGFKSINCLCYCNNKAITCQEGEREMRSSAWLLFVLVNWFKWTSLCSGFSSIDRYHVW